MFYLNIQTWHFKFLISQILFKQIKKTYLKISQSLRLMADLLKTHHDNTKSK